MIKIGKYYVYISNNRELISTILLTCFFVFLTFLAIEPLINLQKTFAFKNNVYNLSHDNTHVPKDTEEEKNKKIIDKYCEKYADQINKLANYKIKIEKETAKQQSLENKTNFDDEWATILSSYNVKNDHELKEEIKNRLKISYFYDDFYKAKHNSFLKNYISDLTPFHIKEIFINIKEMGGNGEARISDEESIKIANVIEMLSEGKDFEIVSALFNEDQTLKQNNSNRIVDILSNDIDDNVKVSIFLFISFFNSDLTEETKKIAKNIFFKKNKNYAEKFLNFGIGKIYIQDALLLSNKKSTIVESEYGFAENNDDINGMHPRDIIFNHFFMTNNVNLVCANSEKIYNYPGFRAISLFNLNYTLCDSKKNPILIICGKHGLHFITINANPFLCKTNYFTVQMPSKNNKKTNIETYITSDNLDIQIMKNKSNELKNHIEQYCQQYIDPKKMFSVLSDINNKKDYSLILKKIKNGDFEKGKEEILKNNFKNYYFSFIDKQKNLDKFRKYFDEFEKKYDLE
ncbi:MAG: hypothetical protein J6Y70_00710 [Bacilli bacterium]|nr:hypothetical protein [Bacilli bacterium]